MIFWQTSKGGGAFSIQKFMGNFKQGFLIMKLIQNCNFRVQGMFFSTTLLRKNQNKTHFDEETSESLPRLGDCQCKPSPDEEDIQGVFFLLLVPDP